MEKPFAQVIDTKGNRKTLETKVLHTLPFDKKKQMYGRKYFLVEYVDKLDADAVPFQSKDVTFIPEEVKAAFGPATTNESTTEAGSGNPDPSSDVLFGEDIMPVDVKKALNDAGIKSKAEFAAKEDAELEIILDQANLSDQKINIQDWKDLV